MRRMLSGAILVVVLSGCIGPADPAEAPGPAGAAAPRPPVVAVIDSGVNPYVREFRQPGAQLSVAQALPLRISHDGTYAERMARDARSWAAVDERTLYHFEDTRLLAISFAARDQVPILDQRGHGTAVAQVAARHAPVSIILALQVDTLQNVAACASGGGCALHPSAADAMEWAAEQPWIDIITSSLGPFGDPPFRSDVEPEVGRWLEASRTASMNGKLVISAAGHATGPYDYTSGPPWVIRVGGAEPEGRGEAADSARGVDLAANMTVNVTPADSVDDEYWTGGTSYAAPAVAGTLAESIRLLRAAGVEPVKGDLRAAVNASAVVFGAAAWTPLEPQGREPLPHDLTRRTLPVVSPVQMGWGYVNSSLAPEIARRVIEQDFSIPPGKEQAALFQPRWQEAREEFWARYS